MELRKCPVCGGKLRSVALGWICYNCQGFIDMQGVFHEHIEKPFMPPKTNADRIRAMSDDELANWLDYMYGRCDWCDTNKITTDDCSDIACTDCIFEWLKQPAEGE